MASTHITRLFTLLLLLCLAISGCDSDDGATTAGGFEDSEQASSIVKSYSEQVIIPTYNLLDVRLASLSSAVDLLQTDTTDTNLEAAQQAWAAARKPWEQSEAFLFGPVDTNGFDPALDSWPVNRTDLDAVLASPDTLTPTFVGALDTTLQGFHTIEYLLFGTNNDKQATDLTTREQEYLTAVVTVMAESTHQLALSWSEGINGNTPYGDVFSTAGAQDNRAYPSLSAAGQEIVNGMIGILDEVANGKIADPFDEQNATLVESQFSSNSLIDFTDNIISVRNAYLGESEVAGTNGPGLNDYIADIDPALDTRIQAELQAAIDALAEIPEPFKVSALSGESETQIRAAQEAIRALQTTMEQNLLPLVTN